MDTKLDICIFLDLSHFEINYYFWEDNDFFFLTHIKLFVHSLIFSNYLNKKKLGYFF